MDRTPARTKVALGVGLLLAVVFSLGARTAGAGTARQLGEVVGAVVAAFGIAAIVWTILWVLVSRRRGGAWLSGWIGVLTAAVALLAAMSRIGEGVERAAEIDAAVEGASVTSEVRECIEGAIVAYDEQPEEERQQLPWGREQAARVAAEYCKELERRGVFEREELPPAAYQQRVMAAVIARMQRDGEVELDSG